MFLCVWSYATPDQKKRLKTAHHGSLIRWVKQEHEIIVANTPDILTINRDDVVTVLGTTTKQASKLLSDADLLALFKPLVVKAKQLVGTKPKRKDRNYVDFRSRYITPREGPIFFAVFNAKDPLVKVSISINLHGPTKGMLYVSKQTWNKEKKMFLYRDLKRQVFKLSPKSFDVAGKFLEKIVNRY